MSLLFNMLSRFVISFLSRRKLKVKVAQSCPTLCNPMDCSMPDFPVHHQLPEFTQIHVQWVGDANQSSHPLSSPSPPALNLSQPQGLFKWVSSSHQVAKVLEFQLQHQSFQCIFSYVYIYVYIAQWNFTQLWKDWNLAICNNVDEFWGHYAKLSQINTCDLTYM